MATEDQLERSGNMTLRWSLKTLLVGVTVICVVMAWHWHLQNRYRDLTAAGAQISYEWESPTLASMEYGLWAGDLAVMRWETKYSIAKTARNRTHAEKFRAWLAGDNVAAVCVPASALNDAAIRSLKNMPQLRCLVLRGAITTKYATEPPLTELLDRLNDVLPDVSVKPEFEQH